ncbi:MAG: hypothetical protein KGL53_01235 [Elusimicrobia bacterium]|nr:hypothetical protein [Elusimicrobiota bacterium]
MRTVLLAILFALPFARPANAASTILGNQDFNMILGYKLWLNSWTTWNTGGVNPHIDSVSKNGVANNINATMRYKQLFTNLGVTLTGDYTFPSYEEDNSTAKVTLKANRTEVDWNIGWMAVPQLGFTVGLKNVHQRWLDSTTGALYQNWNYLGPTVGIVGNAAIGNGFSLYGNGAGGVMGLQITDSHNVLKNPNRHDSATYELAELGIAWKARTVPISATVGYRIQKMSTKLDISGYGDQRGIDLTSGYSLGLNLIF